MLDFILNTYQRLAAKRMFSRWSDIYELEVTENFYSAADRVAASTIKHIAATDFDNPAIADIGIGTGLLAQALFDALSCRITGLDFNDNMLTLCAAKDISKQLIKCDVGKDRWPLTNEDFDVVVSAGLLEYLTPEMLQHFFAESARILHKDGLLIFTYLPSKEKNQKLGIWRGHSGTYLTCAYSPEKIEALLAGHNMTVLEHSDPFKGCLFQDGSSYDYRLIAARKN